MKCVVFVVCALCVLPGFLLFPQEELNGTPVYTYPKLKLDFPLFDLPYQIDTMDTSGYGFLGSCTSLSMDQSLALSTDIYSSMHYGMKKLYDNLTIAPMWKNAIYYGGTAAGILAFAYVLPFGYPWMQQEFTRSVLSRFDIKSINGTYDVFNPSALGGGTDVELIRLKAESPHDLVRMQEANIEGYVALSDRILRNKFFYNLHDLSNVTALLSVWLSHGHSGVGVANQYWPGMLNIDDIIQNWHENDPPQKNRPPYGFSAVNWVYDLFRPDEPYSDRGLHPSGDGTIARYITMAKLSDRERDYLIKQGWLSCLNYASPMLYGFNNFPLGKTGIEWNFALRHYLTSFGSDTPVQILAKSAPFNMLFTYHSYQNYNNYFPAVEAELLDFPVQFAPKLGLRFSPRILLGIQPKDQNFMTGNMEFLGLVGCHVDFAASRHFFPYFDLSVKTDGWIAGNEYLESNVSFKAGVSLRF